MYIDSLMKTAPADVFGEDAFRAIIEAHLPYLKEHPDTTHYTVETHVVWRYAFDFYGLLDFYKVPVSYHWITLRMNGFVSPQDFPTTIEHILIPSQNTVEMIRQIYKTTKSI